MTAEDYQPNEARAIPKGGGVPAVRSTLVPKHSLPNSAGGPWYPAQRRGWGQTYHSSMPVSLSNRQREPIHSSSARSTDRTYSARRISNVVARPPNRMPSSEGRDFSRDRRAAYRHRSSVPAFEVRRAPGSRRPLSADEEMQSGRLGNSKRPKPEPVEEPLRDTHEIVYDVPECSRGDTKQARSQKRAFIKQSIEEIRERFDAKIHSHQINHGKLTISYSYDDNFPASPVGDGTKGHSYRFGDEKSTEQVVKRSSSPSGSNLKLEDIDEYLYTGNTRGSCTIGEKDRTADKEVSTQHKLRSKRYERKGKAPVHGPQLATIPPVIDMSNINYRPFRSGALIFSNDSFYEVPTKGPDSVPASLRAQSTASQDEELTGYCNASQESLETEKFPQPESEVSHKLLTPEPVTIEILDTPSPSPHLNPDYDLDDFDLAPEDILDSPPCLRLDEAGEEFALRVRKEERDKPRRLLHARNRDMSFLVSAHAAVHEITHSTPRRQGEIYRNKIASSDLVEDACLLTAPYDDVIVLAQSTEEKALTLLYTSDDKKGKLMSLKRPSQDPDRRLRGASAVASLLNNPLTFVSGGYDHIVHLWSLSPSIDVPTPEPRPIDIKHSSKVQSLLSVDVTSPKLLTAGADCFVNVWDLPSERPLITIRTSNSVYHLHPTVRPECVLFEVAHRDSQFELHDYRTTSTRPVARFGFHTLQLQGRYTKGDVKFRDGSCTFMSGSRDGCLRLWDLRNTKGCTQEIVCFSNQRIVHAAFEGNQAVAICEDNRMLFFDVNDI